MSSPPAAEWRRLNRRMLVVHPVQEVGRAIPLLVGLLVAGSSQGHGGLWGLVGVGVTLVLGLLRWFTTTYRISGDQVQVRQGVLRRQTLGVPLDRVRTVDVAAPLVHRALGLVRLTIGTGRSDRSRSEGIRLDGLSVADANQLRNELLHRVEPAVEGPRPLWELARARPAWVAYGPFTLSGVVTVGVVFGFAWRIASELRINPERLARESGLAGLAHGGALLLLLPVVALLVVAAVSAAGYALAFWGFRLVRDPGGSLQVTRGLIATRSTTIEERRLRGLEFSEPLLLRAVRGARLIAIATGLRVGRGAERGGSILLPPAPRAEAQRVAAEVLGSAAPVATALIGHGPRARRRRYTRLLLVLVPVLGGLALAWWFALGGPGLPAPYYVGAWAVLLLACLALAEDRHRSLGHALVGRTLVTRRGSLVRRRCAIATDGIIGWNLERSFFQRRAGLATLVATTAAGRQRYEVQDVPLGEALRLADQALPGLLAQFLDPAAPEAPIRS